MANLTIPKDLLARLQESVEIHGYVSNCIAAFVPWISANKTLFFPEYTDHGLTHVQQVIDASGEIITLDALKIVSAGDVAILVVAALLHDCALHISEDGFRTLISGSWASKNTKEADWKVLWTLFVSEATRWDGRKLKTIFGDSAPIHALPKDNYSQRDILLIGEFLRRNHHAIARDIALFGVPGPSQPYLSLPEPAPGVKYIRDIAAIVAESHGSTLRLAAEKLKPSFDPREFKKTHPAYIMCILRVADYIQLQSERAPSQLLDVKFLRSPVSRKEWSAHSSIVDIRSSHEDPEAIYVQVEPVSAELFFKVKSWLQGIQDELDVCWAFIGEVYGRFPHLVKLELRIRRIRSNLDDLAKIKDSFPFALAEARFKAADSDLLKLLISPLYGDRPEVGVRELMQNSIDSVRERSALLGGSEADGKVVSVRVSVDKADKGGIVEISDSGTGMSLRVLTDYFLTAGASYRRSEEWKKQYVELGVLRAGRFGVGALAAFLLGDRIFVSTRHHLEDTGYAFEAGIDDDFIELKRLDREIGTTIRINVTEQNYKKLVDKENSSFHYWSSGDSFPAWNWFCLEQPKLEFKINGREKKSKFSIPLAGAELPRHWHRISDSDYDDIHWTIMDGPPGLCCNGLFISMHPVQLWGNERGLKHPQLSVFDSDGNLPLNLQRTGLTTNRLSFSDLLFRSVASIFIAQVYAKFPTSMPKSLGLAEWASTAKNELSLRRDSWRNDLTYDWLVTSGGIAYFTQESILQFVDSSLLVYRFDLSLAQVELEQELTSPFVVSEAAQNITDMDRIVKDALDSINSGGSNRHNGILGIVESVGLSGFRMALPAKHWTRLLEGPVSVRLPKYLSDLVVTETVVGSLIVIKCGLCEKASIDFGVTLNLASPGQGLISISEFYLKKERAEKTVDEPLYKLWCEFFPGGLLPIDASRRQLALPSSAEFQNLVKRAK